jgi:hypothetical protein
MQVKKITKMIHFSIRFKQICQLIAKMFWQGNYFDAGNSKLAPKTGFSG